MFGSLTLSVLLVSVAVSSAYTLDAGLIGQPPTWFLSHPYDFPYFVNRYYPITPAHTYWRDETLESGNFENDETAVSGDDIVGEIESRTPNRKHYTDLPFHSFSENTKFVSGLGVESRFRPSLRNPLSNSGIYSRLTSLASSFNWMDGTTCTLPNAEAGICSTSRVCSSFGGRSSGSCSSFGSVCCINTVSRCGSTVTLNNTYWQSPSSISSESTCSLSIKLDPTLIEQRRNPICQVRLDFETFSIGQPNTQTVCQVDNFRVSGTTNKVPVICGQNVGQHMYLIAPSSTADIQLIFSLGVGTATDRNWRIRIGLLPCSSSAILAPADCLQYFTQSSGTVRSFNWREMSPTATAPRQLANQDYNICFRTEQISNTNSFSRVSSTICFAPCVITTTAVAPQTTPLAFSLTGDSTSTFLPAGAGSGSQSPQCANTDYLVIDGAVDAALATSFNDRFCGNQLNAQTAPVATTSVTLCSTVKPFNIFYRTDGTESANEFGNNGFCLRFEQRAS